MIVLTHEPPINEDLGCRLVEGGLALRHKPWDPDAHFVAYTVAELEVARDTGYLYCPRCDVTTPAGDWITSNLARILEVLKSSANQEES